MSESAGEGEWLIALAKNRIESTWISAQARARTQRDAHPGSEPDDLANEVIDDAAFWSAVVGAGVGAIESIPAMGQYLAVASIAPELAYLVKLEFDTALNVAAIYQSDVPVEMLTPMILACLVYSMGHEFVKDVAIEAGQRLTRRTIESVLSGATLASAKKIASKLGVQATKKGLLKAVPLVAIPINSALNYGGLQLFGRLAKHYFSANWVMCAMCGHIQPRRNRFCASCAVEMGM